VHERFIARVPTALLVAVVVSGCELQSQGDFDAQPFDTSVQIDRQYQAVYADVVRGARLCWGAGPVVGTMPQAIQLDAQLYPDLGYGEVYSYASGTVFAPQSLVRIEQRGSGAIVSVKAGPVAFAQASVIDPPLRWARGEVRCGLR